MLKVSGPTMIGHLQCLWWWALDHAEDGDLSRFDSFDISLAADWEGDPDEFVAAITNCGPGGSAGFLEPAGLVGDPKVGEVAAGLALHDWWVYAGKLVARRQRDRVRSKADRRKLSEGEDNPTTVPGRSRDRSGTVPRRSLDGPGHTTEQTHTTDKPNTPLPPTGGSEPDSMRDPCEPPAIRDPEQSLECFERCWIAHRDAGASLGTKKAKGRSNSAWKQWEALLRESKLTPAKLASRWRRVLIARREFTPQPQKLLRPSNCMLTDEAVADAEKNSKAKSDTEGAPFKGGGFDATAMDARIAKTKREAAERGRRDC